MTSKIDLVKERCVSQLGFVPVPVYYPEHVYAQQIKLWVWLYVMMWSKKLEFNQKCTHLKFI